MQSKHTHGALELVKGTELAAYLEECPHRTQTISISGMVEAGYNQGFEQGVIGGVAASFASVLIVLIVLSPFIYLKGKRNV